MSLVLLKIGNYTCHDTGRGLKCWPCLSSLKGNQDTCDRYAVHLFQMRSALCFFIVVDVLLTALTKLGKVTAFFSLAHCKAHYSIKATALRLETMYQKSCPSNTRMQSCIIPTRENHQTPACGHRKVLGTVGLASFTLCLPQTRISETNFIGTLIF